MRSAMAVLLVLATGLGLVWLGSSPPVAAQAATEAPQSIWEYKVLSLANDAEEKWEAELNKAGAER